MPRGIRKNKKQANEFFVTPAQDIYNIVHALRLESKKNIRRVLEPAAGSGAFVEVAWKGEFFWDMVAVELECDYFPEELKKRCRYVQSSFLDNNLINSQTIGMFDLVITNPPFTLFHEFLEKSISLLNDNGLVIFLIRLSMLRGVGNGELIDRFHPKEVHILKRAPKFENWRNSAMSGFAWVVWEKEWDGQPTELHWL